jgi:hypothetical protein
MTLLDDFLARRRWLFFELPALLRRMAKEAWPHLPVEHLHERTLIEMIQERRPEPPADKVAAWERDLEAERRRRTGAKLKSRSCRPPRMAMPAQGCQNQVLMRHRHCESFFRKQRCRLSRPPTCPVKTPLGG